MLDQKDFDVVTETKRALEDAFRERVLDAFAVAHHVSVEASQALIRDGRGKDLATTLLDSLFRMQGSMDVVVAMAKQFGLALADLQPAPLRARYAVMQREGRLR